MYLALRRLAFLPAAINSYRAHHRPDNPPPTLSPTLRVLTQFRGGSHGGGGIRVRHPLNSSFGLHLCLDKSIPFDPNYSTQNRCRNTLKRITFARANFGRPSFAAAAAVSGLTEVLNHGEGYGGAANRGGSRSSAGDGLFSIAAQCIFWSCLLVLVGQVPAPMFNPSGMSGSIIEILVLILLTVWINVMVGIVWTFIKGCLYIALVPPLAWSLWRLCRCLWRRWTSRHKWWRPRG
ncbi:unnamed protein product [Linum tenue]|uniref:Uncharacterized protein n=1 Tax=Linum tenue TaxID=586396 RepID=A0AAV0PE58_9ROSI|nr:unnamed protein product [Linum tenue]